MNPARVEFIRTRTAAHIGREGVGATNEIRGLEVLDVGCGGGLLAESLARLGAEVTAIDPAEENIAVATKHSKGDTATDGINYEHTSVEEMVETGKKFDVVCSLEVIEHVDHPLSFIESCAECLKPGGSLFLSTLNRSPKSYLMAILGAEYLLKAVPKGTHDWNKFIKPEEMRKMVDTVATMQEEVGIILDPKLHGAAVSVIDSWRLHPSDLDVNYIVHAVKGRPPAINPDGSLNEFDEPHATEYSLAAQRGELEKLQRLPSEVLNWADSYVNTLLIWAADGGSLSTLQFLLKHSPDSINHQGYLGNTALSRAACGGHVECLEALLAMDAVDANLPNDKKQYPLHIAAFKKNTACVQSFIKSGKCDYAVLDRKGRIPAMDTSDENIKEMLFKAAGEK